MEKIKCSICKNEMPKLRKDKFGYDYCTGCSSETKKAGVSFSFGSGEDTWNDIVIMDDKQLKSYKTTQKLLEKLK